MALPPWLHYAKSRENLERFTLISPPSALETLPALTLAFDCAKKTILSPTGLSTLNQTFTGGDIPPAVFEQELKELEVYVIRWLWKKKEGSYEPFHIVPKNLPNRSVGVGNIFIDILVCILSETWFLKVKLNVLGCSLLSSQGGCSPLDGVRTTSRCFNVMVYPPCYCWGTCQHFISETGCQAIQTCSAGLLGAFWLPMLSQW